MNIENNIRQYLEGKDKNKGRHPDERYASFDYCFNYFQWFKESSNINNLSDDKYIQLSCLQLGFYLASWGMLRGSSFLLEKSVRYLKKLIINISTFKKEVWDIDVDCYTKDNINLLIDCKNMIRESLGTRNSPSDTLVTKIMLGIFGNVPAFDDNFCKGFNLKKSLDKGQLSFIADFYQNNKTIIDKYQIYTMDFFSGKETNRRYTKSKLIDMIGFIEGIKKGKHN